jgi:hypothetical protein
MFCDQCGGQLQAGDQRCTRCGKVIVGLIEARRNRVRQHVRLLGILWLAYSALHVVGGAVLIVISKTLFNANFHLNGGPPPEVKAWLGSFLCFIGWLVLGKAALGFATGFGLLQHEGWGRTLALVMSFIALLSVPVGTALGIYTLWVLLPAQSEDEYKTLAQAA